MYIRIRAIFHIFYYSKRDNAFVTLHVHIGFLNINIGVSFKVNTLFTVEVHYTQIVTKKQFKGNMAKNPNVQEVNIFLFKHA